LRRIYVNSGGYRIMLSLAHGSGRRCVLQAHHRTSLVQIMENTT